MKEYLKMSKHFTGDVTIDCNGNICDDKIYFGSADIAEDYYEHVCHAINSHDELVAEVERLMLQLQHAFMAGWEEGVNGMEYDEAEIASAEIANQFSRK